MKRLFISFLTGMFFFITSLSVSAQEEDAKKEQVDPDPTTAAIQVATNLVNLGMSSKQPLYLISAAQILMDNPLASFELQDADDNPQFDGKTKENDNGLALNPKVLLEEAKKLSNDDNVLALIAEVTAKLSKEEKVVTRGAKYGRVYTSRRVNSNSTYTFYITYTGGRRATLSLVGDGDTDLDFYVYKNGTLVGSDDDYTDEAYFYWTPRYDTEYKVRVVNRGNVYNVFKVISN